MPARLYAGPLQNSGSVKKNDGKKKASSDGEALLAGVA